MFIRKKAHQLAGAASRAEEASDFEQDLAWQLHQAQAKFDAMQADVASGLRAWEKLARPGSQWFTARALSGVWPLDDETGRADGTVTFTQGRIGRAAVFDGHSLIDLGNAADLGFLDKFTISAWINTASPEGAIISRAKDEAEGAGYSIVIKGGKLQANFVLRNRFTLPAIRSWSTTSRASRCSVVTSSCSWSIPIRNCFRPPDRIGWLGWPAELLRCRA